MSTSPSSSESELESSVRRGLIGEVVSAVSSCLEVAVFFDDVAVEVEPLPVVVELSCFRFFMDDDVEDDRAFDEDDGVLDDDDDDGMKNADRLNCCTFFCCAGLASSSDGVTFLPWSAASGAAAEEEEAEDGPDFLFSSFLLSSLVIESD